MRTLIHGGWVVAFRDGGHQVFEDGAVVFDDDRIVHAGPAYTGPTDGRIDAHGMLVCPGFINTHVHPVGNGSDYLLLDSSRNDYRSANYLAFAAPLKGKASLPPPENVAALRTFVFLHALKQGSTTIMDVGGLRGEYDSYARIVEAVGLRVYASPSFRDRNTFSDSSGRIFYDEDVEAGRKGLSEAVDFVRKYDGAVGGRLRGLLNPAQVETCTEGLLRACKDEAGTLNVPVHTHAGGNLLEFQRVLQEHRKTPIQFLADIGFLDERTLIGHAVFTSAHPWSLYPFGDDLAVLRQSGATVGHCPYKYAKVAMLLQSFDRYRAAGVNVALGTDTYPMDIISEMRWASTLAKVADRNYQAGAPREVFNAATVAACRFIQRDDLGRLAPGAKADVLLVRMQQMVSPPFRDPIKALVEYGSGRDVDTVIVDGKVLVRDGRAQGLDEEAIHAKAAQAVAAYWSHVPRWHWAGKEADGMVPPAFPMHRTTPS
jgi:cytosine/adenosine deaminase-related metal-dependent hydrolase